MFFVFNLRPSSQAECRRFDPGLPLQFFLRLVKPFSPHLRNFLHLHHEAVNVSSAFTSI